MASERKSLEAQIDALDDLNGSGILSRSAKSSRKPAATRGRRAHPLKGKKAAAKYRGPNGETWAGRGLAPRWLSELEAKGKKRDSFLIKG